MHTQIQSLLNQQHGLLLRRQALKAGMTSAQVQQRLRSGEWQAVRHGVYTTAEHWQQLDAHQGRPLLVVRAASMNMSKPHVLSHSSAALLHGMQVLRPRDEAIHVTRFGVLGTRSRHGVKHHTAPFTPDQVLEIDGLMVLDRARTAVDIARESGFRAGVVACDAARRLGDSRDDLVGALAAMRYWPHVTTARDAVAASDPWSESIGESLARVMLAELGLGPVETQFGLRRDGREAWADLRLGRHLVEFDGRTKYRRTDEGGLSQRNAEDVLWDEKRRQDWLCSFKLGMSRLVWDDVMPRNWAATSRQLRREVLDTLARFGSSLTDLEPYRLALPRH